MATTMAAGGIEYFDLREDRRQERRKAIRFAVVFALMFLYPFLDRALGINRLGEWMAIFVWVILAMGLNIVVGYAGLLDLGYAAFFAIGAYANGFLTSPSSVFVQRGWVPEALQHFWPALAISWFVAAIFGVLLGAPTLRLRGDYLAIVTLGFGEIVPNFFYNAEGITGGTIGLNPISKPPTIHEFTLFDWHLPLPFTDRALHLIPGLESTFTLPFTLSFGATDQRNWYWLMLVVGVFSVFLINRLYDSRLGRSWQAIREDELAAASMGINLVRTKLWAFALGASFSGFAGSIFAAAFQYVHPSQFEFTVSIMILSMVILGGLGNIYGVIFGGLLIASFDRILAEELNGPVHWVGDRLQLGFLQNHNVSEDRLLVFGLALVVMMVLRPGGLIPSARRKAEMRPESDDIVVAETEALYDVQHERGTALGGGA